MEGETYISINPATLDDASVWSYRDLQLLSKRVGLRSNLKRENLVKNLIRWHRTRTQDEKCLVPPRSVNEENIEMNCVGQNLLMVPVNVTMGKKDDGLKETSHMMKSVTNSPTVTRSASKSGRKSILNSPLHSTGKASRRGSLLSESCTRNSPVIVSPTLLLPLTPKREGTPGRSILKQRNTNQTFANNTPSRRLSNISFSPVSQPASQLAIRHSCSISLLHRYVDTYE